MIDALIAGPGTTAGASAGAPAGTPAEGAAEDGGFSELLAGLLGASGATATAPDVDAGPAGEVGDPAAQAPPQAGPVPAAGTSGAVTLRAGASGLADLPQTTQNGKAGSSAAQAAERARLVVATRSAVSATVAPPQDEAAPAGEPEIASVAVRDEQVATAVAIESPLVQPPHGGQAAAQVATSAAAPEDIGSEVAGPEVAGPEAATAVVPAVRLESSTDAGGVPDTAPGAVAGETPVTRRPIPGPAAQQAAAAAARQEPVLEGREGEQAAPGIALREAPAFRERPAPRADAAKHLTEGVTEPDGVTGPDGLGTPGIAESRAPIVPAATLGRVLDAVEAAEQAPPPRTVALELALDGGEDAVRLLVTLRGETVHLSGDGVGALPAGWGRELADALAQRGFTFAGFGGQERRGRGQAAAEDDDRPDPRRSALRPAASTDDGALRL